MKYTVKLIDGKLMLTSTDIKVGDKIRGEYPSTLGYDVECLREDPTPSSVPHWIVKGLDGGEYFYAKVDSFKIVGEISPNALNYVKERDEFTEDQIKPIIDRRITNFDPQMDWTECEWKDYVKWVEIKCPQCLNYH